MFSFEKLEVWRKGMDFAELIYKVTARFPQDEKFGLVSQLRRAALSISANVAEGNSHSSRKDFTRFIEVAYGSLMESVSHIHLSHRLAMVAENDLVAIRGKAEELARMLSGPKASLEK